MLYEVITIHPGIFAVMDGTTAGDGPGPRTMFPVVKDYILASADQVAIDAVAAYLMGFDPMTIDYLRIAHDLGAHATRQGDGRGLVLMANAVANVALGQRGHARVRESERLEVGVGEGLPDPSYNFV